LTSSSISSFSCAEKPITSSSSKKCALSASGGRRIWVSEDPTPPSDRQVPYCRASPGPCAAALRGRTRP
jgi:hypothetical protein